MRSRSATIVHALVAVFVVGAAPSLAIDYVYDQRDRLVEIVYDDGTVATYSYDAAGNRLARAVTEDRDGDGIPYAGGSNPCTGGNTADCEDNCRYRANPDQSDANGDGIGDACQCGDMNGNGLVDGPDLTLYQRYFGGLPSPFSMDRCGVSPAADGGTCDGADLTVIKRYFGGLPPGITNTCAAYVGP